jgi:hypothetical protein
MSIGFHRMACFVLAALGAAGSPLAALDYPDLSGKWQLNPDLSDNPSRVLRGGRGRGGAPDGPDADLFEGIETLMIEHREPRLSITDGAGRTRVVFTDGRKVDEERPSGGKRKVLAVWKDGHVEISSKTLQGPNWMTTLAVSADRSQLRVTTRVDGERGTFITIHLVYEPASSKPRPPKAPPAARDDLPPEL